VLFPWAIPGRDTTQPGHRPSAGPQRWSNGGNREKYRWIYLKSYGKYMENIWKIWWNYD